MKLINIWIEFENEKASPVVPLLQLLKDFTPPELKHMANSTPVAWESKLLRHAAAILEEKGE